MQISVKEIVGNASSM